LPRPGNPDVSLKLALRLAFRGRVATMLHSESPGHLSAPAVHLEEADLVLALEDAHPGRVVHLADVDETYLYFGLEGERGLLRRTWQVDDDCLVTVGEPEQLQPRWREEGRDMTHKMSAFQGKAKPKSAPGTLPRPAESRFMVQQEPDLPIEAQASNRIAALARQNKPLSIFLSNCVTDYLRKSYLGANAAAAASAGGDEGYMPTPKSPYPDQGVEYSGPLPEVVRRARPLQPPRGEDYAEITPTDFQKIEREKKR
jgi:hypothetical protein